MLFKLVNHNILYLKHKTLGDSLGQLSPTFSAAATGFVEDSSTRLVGGMVSG